MTPAAASLLRTAQNPSTGLPATTNEFLDVGRLVVSPYLWPGAITSNPHFDARGRSVERNFAQASPVGG